MDFTSLRMPDYLSARNNWKILLIQIKIKNDYALPPPSSDKTDFTLLDCIVIFLFVNFKIHLKNGMYLSVQPTSGPYRSNSKLFHPPADIPQQKHFPYILQVYTIFFKKIC